MNHLDVGVDKGRSKTNLAVARADGHLLLEARIEHFDRINPQPITDEPLSRRIPSLSSSAGISKRLAASSTVCLVLGSMCRRSKSSPMFTTTTA